MTSIADADLVAQGRRSWGALEPIHVIGYFAPEVAQGYVDLGLHKRLAYFAARSAAFGRAPAELTIATFYVFAPWLPHKALPASWEIAAPEQIQRVRREGVAVALERVLGSPDVGEALELARTACEGLSPPGRPLYAAHSALAWPGDDLLALWHAATLLREHRGDAHIAVLLKAGLDPVESLILGGMFSKNTDFVRSTRGWTDEEWAGGEQRLVLRGLIDGADLTDEGRALRQQIEDDTDELAAEGWARLGLAGSQRLYELVSPLRKQVLDSGVLPDWISRRG